MKRTNSLQGKLLTVSLLVACSMHAKALVIDLDLNDGVLTEATSTTPASYSTGVFAFDSPIALLIGEALNIRVNFIDGITGAKQHLELIDAPPAPPAEPFSPVERMLFGFFGTQTVINLGDVDVSITDVTLDGVMGDLKVNGFDSTPPLCAIFLTIPQKVGCESHIGTPDLTDTAFSFHGFEFELTLQESKFHSGDDFEPIAFQEGRFTFQANEIQRGTWPIPEPMSAALFGLGLVGIGLGQRRKVRR